MAKHEYVVVSKGALILPTENGGTKRLSPGQIVVGPHFAKFVGKGLRPHVQAVPKPTPAQMPPPFQKAGTVQAEEAPKGKEVARSKPAEEPKATEPPAEAPEETAEVDTLPSNKSELEKMLKEDVVALAAELGLDTEGNKADVVKRVAKELGL